MSCQASCLEKLLAAMSFSLEARMDSSWKQNRASNVDTHMYSLDSLCLHKALPSETNNFNKNKNLIPQTSSSI